MSRLTNKTMTQDTPEPVPCATCGGACIEIIGENRVTLDMAIDAGDRNMEGMFHSYATAECHACEGTGIEPNH